MEAAFGIVGEPPEGEAGGRGSSPRRWLAPLGVFVGAAGFAASLTCTYLAMRDLMVNSGGSCASGGPYAVAAGHECGSEATMLFVGIVALLMFRGPQVRAKVNEGLVYEGVPGIAYTARAAEPGEVPAPSPPADEPQASSPLPKRLNIPRREWRAP